MDEKDDSIQSDSQTNDNFEQDVAPFNSFEILLKKRREQFVRSMTNKGYTKDTCIAAFRFANGNIQSATNAIEQAECYGVIKECQYFVTMKDILDSYTNDNHTDNLTQLLDCFNHILTYHTNNDDFAYIYQRLGECDIQKCETVKRHYRNRIHKNESTIDDEKSVNAFSDITVYDAIIDKIHCHFIHCYDMGYRLVNNNLNINDIYFNQIYRQEFNKFNQFIPQNQTGYSMGQQFWYWPEITKRSFDLHKWIISKKFANMKEELTQNPFVQLAAYQWGLLYSKAQVYQNTHYYRTLTANEAFIMSTTFKPLSNFDIKNNSPIALKHLISVMVYCGYTALSSAFSKTFRRLKDSNNVGSDSIKSEEAKSSTDKSESIKINALRRQHIGKETNDALKQRNSNFYHLSRYLIESVNIFSQPHWIKNSNSLRTYHGVSEKLIFSGMVCRMYQPFSTSESMEVAIMFGNQTGLIVELTCQPRQRYFRCDIISDFPNEHELLFMYNSFPVKFVNIIDANSGVDYAHFVQSISIIDSLISGRQYQNDCTVMMNLLQAAKQHLLNGEEIDKTDPLSCGGCKIPKQIKLLTQQLIRYEMHRNGYGEKINLKLDPYVDALLHQCCIYKEQISFQWPLFDVETLKKCHQDGYQGYRFLRDMFCENTAEFQMCNVKFICNLLPNTKVISITNMSNISKECIEYILNYLKTKPPILRSIMLTLKTKLFDIDPIKHIDSLIDTYSKKFDFGWNIWRNVKSSKPTLFIAR
eukprot:393988_1